MDTRPPGFNKVRVYDCPCRGQCVRPLHGEPRPCDLCGTPLDPLLGRVEDHALFIQGFIRSILGKE